MSLSNLFRFSLAPVAGHRATGKKYSQSPSAINRYSAIGDQQRPMASHCPFLAAAQIIQRESLMIASISVLETQLSNAAAELR